MDDIGQQVTWDVRGRTVLVTGGNSGIGRATALELARRGAEVILTARDPAKGQAAEDELGRELAALRLDEHAEAQRGGSIGWMHLDLADLASIARFAADFQERFSALHVLIHNAGLVLSDRRTTADGFEATFGTNHLGTFALNQLLLSLLRRSAPARVVVVASDAHRRARRGLDLDDLQAERRYAGVEAYSRSKLANVLFASALARRLEGSGVTANSLHPGVVATGFTLDGDARGLWGFVFRYLRPFLRTPEAGARTSVHLACAPELGGISGRYFARCREVSPSAAARDEAAGERLWGVSEELLQSARFPPAVG